MQSDFSTFIRVQLWVTRDLGLTDLAPNFVFDSRMLDMECNVRITEDHEEVEFTLWNVADPAVSEAVFRRDYIVAIDMARQDFNNLRLEPQYTRVCIARIKSRNVQTSEEDMDVGYEVKAIPITETLQEIEVQLNFPEETGPYRLKDVIQEILSSAGIGAFSILLQGDYRIPSYTGDGPMFSELKRAAGKAGVPIGIWMRGGNIIVSDRYLLGRTMGDNAILRPSREENPTAQPSYPVLTPEAPQTGEGQDLSEQYEAQPTEADMVALDGAVSKDTYRIEMPLTPDIFKGDSIGINGPRTLAKLGFRTTMTQFFNVVGVEHSASSENESPMDTTTITATVRDVEDAEEAPTVSPRSPPPPGPPPPPPE